MKKQFLTLLNQASLPYLPNTSDKHLSIGKRATGGRNNLGRITIRRRGGGHKRRVYIVDYTGTVGGPITEYKIKDMQYNPNSSSQAIFVCTTPAGRLKYMPYVEGYKIGDPAPKMEKIGEIRVGTSVCNLEITPGKGGQYIRSAGTSGIIIKKEGERVQIKLPSGTLLDVKTSCKVLRGRIGNEEHRNRVIGKAGRNRWLGIRPRVRGEAMNPVDHPHGGKSSRSGGRGKPFKNIWGKLAKWSS